MMRIGKITAVLFIVLTLCAGSLNADIVEIGITAEVTYINEYPDILEGKIKVGDIITGRYTYDSNTPDSSSSTTVGSYWHYHSPYGIYLSAGEFNFRTDLDNVEFHIGIGNNSYGADFYNVSSYNNLPLDAGTFYIPIISWGLVDYSGIPISSTVLPTTPPVLEDWPDYWYSNILRIEASIYPGGGCNWIVLDAKVISVELVETIEASIDISPDTLNLQSEGRFVSCRIRLPEGYDIDDIDPNSILLEDELQPERIRLNITDQLAVVRFSRQEIEDMLSEVTGLVELKVSGRLNHFQSFEGTDIIRIISEGKKGKPRH